eukprot:GHRQ01019333.1.p1 GENE.GHRQ01019333.1~~GHRQ01019333.1.p1  ORF type:complete len:158 (+),score=48.71 GHRQ01019333.1:291-764(+)
MLQHCPGVVPLSSCAAPLLLHARALQALSYCDEDFMLQLQGPHLDKAEEVTNPVYLNMAAAQLKLGDHAAAAHNATQVRGHAACGSGSTEHCVALPCTCLHEQTRVTEVASFVFTLFGLSELQLAESQSTWGKAFAHCALWMMLGAFLFGASGVSLA